MEAYKVFYSTTSKEDSVIVLIERDSYFVESSITQALAKKDRAFRLDSKFHRIISFEEIPLSNVLVKDLSITEFLSLTK